MLLNQDFPHAGIPTLAEETRLMPQHDRVFNQWLKAWGYDSESDRIVKLMRSAYFTGVRTCGG